MTMPQNALAVVVDRDFGNRLLELAQRLHVWICTSEKNRQAFESVCEQAGTYSTDEGATIFNAAEGESPGGLVMNMLPIIEEHHPSWSVLEIYGTACTPALREVLREYGFTELQEGMNRFIATRPAQAAL